MTTANQINIRIHFINISQATKRVARQRKIYNNVPPVYILLVK